MSPLLAVYMFGVTVLTIISWYAVLSRSTSDGPPSWWSLHWVCWSVWVGGYGLIRLIEGHMFAGVVNAALAGVYAWLAWKHRNRKDRKPSKVLAKVRDLGHRLVVTPT